VLRSSFACSNSKRRSTELRPRMLHRQANEAPETSNSARNSWGSNQIISTSECSSETPLINSNRKLLQPTLPYLGDHHRTNESMWAPLPARGGRLLMLAAACSYRGGLPRHPAGAGTPRAAAAPTPAGRSTVLLRRGRTASRTASRRCPGCPSCNIPQLPAGLVEIGRNEGRNQALVLLVLVQERMLGAELLKQLHCNVQIGPLVVQRSYLRVC
jgi:hypothetical protein